MKSPAVALALVFLTIVSVPVVYIMENYGGSHSDLHFWLRVLVGGWPVSDVDHSDASVEFAFAVKLALLLRLGPILLLVELFFLLLRSAREQSMNRAQSLMLRDRSIKNSILARFPESERASVRDKIDDAFREGNQVWEEKHLVTVLGESGAEKVRKGLRDELP